MSPNLPPRAALLLLALGACAEVPESVAPPGGVVLSTGEADVVLRARFDPLQQAYFTDVLPVRGTDAAITRDEAVALVEDGLGTILCEGGQMRVVDGVWGVVAPADPVTAYPSRGGWQVVAACA